MDKKQADHISLPQEEERIWELYHENSKYGSWDRGSRFQKISDKRISRMHLSLPFQAEWVKKISLSPEKLTLSLQEALHQRRDCREMVPTELKFEQVSSLLHAGLGITKQPIESRGLRSAPSAGNTFPVEGFFYSANCEHLPRGLYHFSPEKDEVQLLKKGDHASFLESAVMQDTLPADASIVFFLTGVLKRTSRFFGERGYRFALMEAGHIAQNIQLAATSLALGCVHIYHFHDRKIETYLEIDGIDHSILAIIAIGTEKQIPK